MSVKWPWASDSQSWAKRRQREKAPFSPFLAEGVEVVLLGGKSSGLWSFLVGSWEVRMNGSWIGLLEGVTSEKRESEVSRSVQNKRGDQCVGESE